MSKFKDDLKRSLDIATDDKTSVVIRDSNAVVELLNRIDLSRLSAEGRQQVAEISQQLSAVRESFDQSYQSTIPVTAAEVKRVKLFNLARKVGQFAIFATGLATLFNGETWWLGLLLIVGMFVGRAFAKKFLLKKAQQSARSSWRTVRDAQSMIGNIDSASGLAGKADTVFQSTLTEMERIAELSRRQAERQHREALAVQQQQLAAMREQNEIARLRYEEQVTQTGILGDMAYIRPKDRYKD